MPPRLNKRQQRELQEQQLLKDQTVVVAAADEASSEEENVPAAAVTTNLFGALNLGAEDEEEKEDDEDEGEPETVAAAKAKAKKKSKKKKKKAVAAAGDGEATPPVSSVAAPAATATPEPEASTSTPKKKKEKKPKKDELDQALEELAKKYPDIRRRPAGHTSEETVEGGSHTTTAATRLRALLSVSYKDLDPSVELRRFFGSRVISQNTPPPNRRHGPVLRSRLTKPAPNWPPGNSRQGIDMRALEEAEVAELVRRRGWEKGGDAAAGGRWWTAEHSRAYKAVQQQFLQAVGSHDPNSLMALLQVYPWHVDTLLQMSSVATQQGDLTLASEFIERAIFGFERCFVPAFNLSTGSARLDFDRIENRPFFMALSKYVAHLQRRGCPRTAFEFARLLWALDPIGDPHGASLWLDYLAIKAGQGSFITDVWDKWGSATNALEMNSDADVLIVQYLPGWAYARALAIYDAETVKGDTKREASTNALSHAIYQFPMVVPVLADKAGISLSAEARAHKAFQLQIGFHSDNSSTLHLLAHLYAQRSNTLWKNPPYSTWFASVVPTCLPNLHKPYHMRVMSEVHTRKRPTPLWISRHLVVAELNPLFTFLPPYVTRDIGMGYDPLPPGTSISTYDDQYFEFGEARAGGRGWQRVIAGGEGGQAGFMARLMELLGGEGGNEQEQMALQQALMEHIQAQQAERGGAPVAPGAWEAPDADAEDPDDEAEDELAGPGETPDQAGGMRGLLNGLLGRLLGGRRDERDEGDEDEDEDEDEDDDETADATREVD